MHTNLREKTINSTNFQQSTYLLATSESHNDLQTRTKLNLTASCLSRFASLVSCFVLGRYGNQITDVGVNSTNTIIFYQWHACYPPKIHK